MRFDFSTIDDTRSFVSVPEGTYDCRIADVRERLSREGSMRWSFRLEVIDGDYAGRSAAWDSVTWSDRGMGRVKLVLGALGFDTSGPLEVESSDLVDRCVRASFVLESRENPVNGERLQTMRVPFAGYGRLGEGNNGVERLEPTH